MRKFIEILLFTTALVIIVAYVMKTWHIETTTTREIIKSFEVSSMEPEAKIIFGSSKVSADVEFVENCDIQVHNKTISGGRHCLRYHIDGTVNYELNPVTMVLRITEPENIIAKYLGEEIPSIYFCEKQDTADPAIKLAQLEIFKDLSIDACLDSLDLQEHGIVFQKDKVEIYFQKLKG